MSSYLNVTRNTYWDSASNTNYSVSVSKTLILAISGISASLAVSRIRWDDDKRINITSLLSTFTTNRNISYSMQRTEAVILQMISKYDSSDRNNIWNISASATDDNIRDGEPTLRGSYQRYSPWGRLNINGGVQPNQYNSLPQAGTVHLPLRHGVALHDYSYADNARDGRHRRHLRR
ncbi:MAG: fimbria/pilus outer membrane usher protein [Escherichia coli]